MEKTIALHYALCFALSPLWNMLSLCGLSEVLDILCLKYIRFHVTTVAWINMSRLKALFTLLHFSAVLRPFLPLHEWSGNLLYCLSVFQNNDLPPQGTSFCGLHVVVTQNVLLPGGFVSFVVLVGQLQRRGEAFHNSVTTRVVRPTAVSMLSMWCCTGTIVGAFTKTEKNVE